MTKLQREFQVLLEKDNTIKTPLDMYEIGMYYEMGCGVVADKDAASKWYNDIIYDGSFEFIYRQAKEGNPRAQFIWGRICEKGQVGKKNIKKALKWYKRAAKNKNSSAQRNLGYLFYHGKEIDKDLAVAACWLQESAAQGNALAQYSLAWMYYHGKGLKEDLASAMHWYFKSAIQGSVRAQRKLGKIYTEGSIRIKDKVQSIYWYSRAVKQGDEEAKACIKRVCALVGSDIDNSTRLLKSLRKVEKTNPVLEQILLAIFNLDVAKLGAKEQEKNNLADLAEIHLTQAKMHLAQANKGIANLSDLSNLVAYTSILCGEYNYTIYHLIALLGRIDLLKELQENCKAEKIDSWQTESLADLTLSFDTIIVRDSRGLIARQLAKVLSDFSVRKINSSSSAQNEIDRDDYFFCVEILSELEEEATLKRLLFNQRSYEKAQLTYQERSSALEHCLNELVMSDSNETLRNIETIWIAKGALCGIREKIEYKKVQLEEQRIKKLLVSAETEPTSISREVKLSKVEGKTLKFLSSEKVDPSLVKAPFETMVFLFKKNRGNWLDKDMWYTSSMLSYFYDYIKDLQSYLSQYQKNFKKLKAKIDIELCRAVETNLIKLINAFVKCYQRYQIDERSEESVVRYIDMKHLKKSNLWGPTPAVLFRANQRRACFVMDEIDAILTQNTQSIEKLTDIPEHGTAQVFPIQGVHYKYRPHAPGVEFMVSSLGNILAGEGAAPTTLLKVIAGNGASYVYQASHTVKGKNLHSVLRYHPDCIDKIRMDNFSIMTLLGILTDPQDGKPDNLMVEFSLDANGQIETIRIIGVDNDIAFSDVVIIKPSGCDNKNQHFINVKNVLYFFPQMQRSIDPIVRNNFLSRQPELLLCEWLLDLHEKNNEYEDLLAKGIFSEREYNGDGVIDKRGLQLPIKLTPGTLKTLYRKFCQLKATLKSVPEITLWQLLALLEPALAKHYARVKEKHTDADQRCDIMACIVELYEEGIADGSELKCFRMNLDAGLTRHMTELVIKTAEQFGFEDNRTNTLQEEFIEWLSLIDYKPYYGRLSFSLFHMLEKSTQHLLKKSLLEIAFEKDYCDLLTWLWAEGLVNYANILKRSKQIKSQPLLHYLVIKGHLVGAKACLSGDNAQELLDEKTQQGYTALHRAAGKGDLLMVELLLEKGAEPNSRTALGKTPWDIAKRRLDEQQALADVDETSFDVGFELVMEFLQGWVVEDVPMPAEQPVVEENLSRILF